MNQFRGMEPIPVVIGRGGLQPGQVTSPSQDYKETNKTNSHRNKPDTHFYRTGTTCKLHTERPWVGFKPGTFDFGNKTQLMSSMR